MSAPTLERTRTENWTRPFGAITALDGLRALAIVLVVGRHGVRPFWTETGFISIGGYDIGTAFHNGWLGVDLFFVLSGFLITLHIVRRYGNGFSFGDLGDYARRRSYRIVPAYLASIVLAISGVIPYFEVSRENLLWRLLYHFAFLQDYLTADIQVVYWSLGVEEKFYLIAPFVLIAVIRLPHRLMRYGTIAALGLLPTVFRLAKFRSGQATTTYLDFFVEVRSPFHLTFDGLVFGVLAALIYLDRDELAWTKRGRTVHALAWTGISSFAALLFHHPLLVEISWFNQTVMQLVVALSSTAILLGLVLGGGPTKILSGDSLFVVGKLSYAWYLVHLLVIPMSIVVANAVGGNALAQILIFVPVYLASSLGLAWLLHAGVERPFLALRDRRKNEAMPAS